MKRLQGRYWLLVTKGCWKLQAFTGSYKGLQLVINCYDRIQTVRGHFKEFQGLGSCRGNRRLLGAVGGYGGLQEVTGSYRGLKGNTRGYKVLQGVTMDYKGFQGATGG